MDENTFTTITFTDGFKFGKFSYPLPDCPINHVIHKFKRNGKYGK